MTDRQKEERKKVTYISGNGAEKGIRVRRYRWAGYVLSHIASTYVDNLGLQMSVSLSVCAIFPTKMNDLRIHDAQRS